MTFEKQNAEVAPGINYEYVYVKAADSTKATFLFLHGFPSSYYCWRHQIKYFSEQGYGCLAPNLMGYGKTYSPIDDKEYRTKDMVQHLVTLLDHLGLDRVIVVGHDWGIRPTTRFILYHPERTQGAIFISVGYRPPARLDLEQAFQLSKKAFGYENFGYWKFFEADDAATLIQNNVDSFLDIGFASDPSLWATDFAPLGKIREWVEQGKTTTRASFFTEEDANVLRQYVAEGMQPKLNWYKSAIANIDYEDEKNLDPNIKCPVLFIGGTKDAICIPKLFADQKNYIANLESFELDSSHWMMEEKPNEVNELIQSWLAKLH